MFDDLSDLSLDADFLDALAEIDLGDGLVSAHDVEAINYVLGASMGDISGDFAHLSPDVAAVLSDALGLESDALGSFRPDADHIHFVDPFGDALDADIDGALGANDPSDGVYTDAQAMYAVTGAATDAGFSFLPDADQAFSCDVPVYPGEYVLDTHGNAATVSVDGAELTATDFAEVVAHETNWNGEPIRLFSCNTGEEVGGFAQQLADELGIQVTAPTETVWSVEGGTPIIGNAVFDPVTGLYGPPAPSSGEWLTFMPQAA